MNLVLVFIGMERFVVFGWIKENILAVYLYQ